MVREHPLLTEIGSYQRPRQLNLPRLTTYEVALAAPMVAEQSPGRPAAADCGKAFRPMRTRSLTRFYWARWVVELTDTMVETSFPGPFAPLGR